jgi:hypothetical protein
MAASPEGSDGTTYNQSLSFHRLPQLMHSGIACATVSLGLLTEYLQILVSLYLGTQIGRCSIDFNVFILGADLQQPGRSGTRLPPFSGFFFAVRPVESLCLPWGQPAFYNSEAVLQTAVPVLSNFTFHRASQDGFCGEHLGPVVPIGAISQTASKRSTMPCMETTTISLPRAQKQAFRVLFAWAFDDRHWP